MKQTMTKLLNRKNKKFMTSLIVLFFISTAVSAYSLLQPTTITKQTNENTAQVQTQYDYKATVTPNILHPDGGTIEADDTIFKQITTSIPLNMNTTINSNEQVLAEGTHEVQLLVKAGNLWEKAFPLEEKQPFKQEGTNIAVIDDSYKINLENIKSFITQVEEETGISPDQYTLEVVPNIEGTITSGGVEKAIQAQDHLAFQLSYNEITLASEKVFTSAVPFTMTETMTNTLTGLELPLTPVRTTSTILSLLLLAAIIFAYRDLINNRERKPATLAEKINNKHGNRIIPVKHKVNIAKKSIFTLDSFKSVIKIADEKELPIFCYNDHHDGSAVYFIVDGDYLYSYETHKSIETRTGSETAYAKG
ncbi:DUF5305 family protein [Virgibacillus doumboii]|uniref:DUF5305 family protein n=1 Tax=Virgibacillus doumboii TaxID=2697503 RepID=UPI0013E04750|nr:DUF5305 family protein [Virgibacillus doumboii]